MRSGKANSRRAQRVECHLRHDRDPDPQGADLRRHLQRTPRRQRRPGRSRKCASRSPRISARKKPSPSSTARASSSRKASCPTPTFCTRSTATPPILSPTSKLIDLLYAPAGRLPQRLKRAAWAMNDTTLAAVPKLKDGQHNYLWQPSFQIGQPGDPGQARHGWSTCRTLATAPSPSSSATSRPTASWTASPCRSCATRIRRLAKA